MFAVVSVLSCFILSARCRRETVVTGGLKSGVKIGPRWKNSSNGNGPWRLVSLRTLL